MKSLIKSFAMRGFSLVCADRGPKVVYYHDVHMGRQYTHMSTSLKMLLRHIDSARRRGYGFVATYDELKKCPPNSKKVLMSFDDGFRGVWDCRKFFCDNEITPTVFLAVELVGKPGYLTWDEVSELQKMGFVFESHTWSHRSLTEVPQGELEHELRASRLLLSEKLGKDVKSLCFPRGLFSREILTACSVAGYTRLFTCIPGSLGSLPSMSPEVDLIPRNFAQGCSAGDFCATLAGGQFFLRNRYLQQHCR